MSRLFFIAFWLCAFMVPLVAVAGPISFTGDWRYERTSDNGDLDWMFLENYSLGLEKELTDTISVSGSVRYTKKRDPEQTLQTINPSVALDWKNYIFSFYISASSNRRLDSDGPDHTSNSWDANLCSNWSDRWPSIRLYYGRSRDYDDQHPRETDTKSKHKGVDVNYEYSIFKVYYNYRDSKTEDLVDDSTTWDYNHFASIEASKDFFDHRLSLSASHQISYTKNETETKAKGGKVVIPVSVVMGYSGVDDSPEDGTLASNPALIDGDRFTSAGVDIGNTEDVNLALETVYREVNLIYVYTEDDVPSSWVGQYRWELYKSSDGTNWDLVALNLSYSYDHDAKRFEIELPDVTDRYVKLYVAQIPDSGDVYVTEMEAYYEETTSKSKVTTVNRYRGLRSSFNLNWRPWETVLASYNSTLNKAKPDPGPDSRDVSHSASVEWSPSRYFSPSVHFGTTSRTTDGEKKRKSYNYSLTINSSPLDTLDLSWGASRNEEYEGGDKESRTDTLDFYATATIFPDLTANLDLVHTTTKDYEEGDTTRSFSARFTTTARLSPKLTLDGTLEYSRSTGDEDTTTERAYLSATWRVSDILLLRSTQDVRWEDEGTGYSSTYTLWVAPTSKIQVNAQYTYSEPVDGDTSHIFSTFLSWAINRHFSFKTNYSYDRSGTDDHWTFGVQLTARF